MENQLTKRSWQAAGVLVAVLLGINAERANINPLRSTDLYKFQSVVDVRLSPDGDRLAYSVENYDRPGRPYTQVWIMQLANRKLVRLGAANGISSDPRWSPDGSSLAYLANEGDKTGIFVSDREGAQQQFLSQTLGTNSPLPFIGDMISWSPDSKRIAFVSATPGPETGDASGDPIVITRYLYKPNWLEGLSRFNDNRRLHIFVVDVHSKQIRQITTGKTYEHSISWSPISDEILFVSNHGKDPDRVFNYDIFALNATTGTVRQITNTTAVEYIPQWSPDGKLIAYLGTKRSLTSSETTMEDTHVWVMNADGTGRREVGTAVNNRQDSVAWSPDNKSVYTTVEEGGSVHLYQIPLVGGQAAMTIGGRGNVAAWSASNRGPIAYAFYGEHDMGEVFLKSGNKSEQLTNLNTTLIAGKDFAPVEAFTFQSFDGRPVEAFLTKPPGLDSSSKHPMVVEIHGGPHGQQGPEFSFLAQIYAAQGWATLMVNYRGSTGYGQQFADAIFGDQDGGEARDVIYGVQAALGDYGWIDADRLGISGVSYGGQLTDWIITQTSIFKAAIPTAGISNLVSFNYMAYYHDYLAVEFGVYPHQENLMDKLWERSALRYVARVRTPTMLVHGENDNDVPIAEAEQYYIGLKDVGVETVMVRYPREGHGLQEPKHIVDFLDRSIAWFSQHFNIGAQGGAVAQQ
jgi:dipeptidyl aminopeptidase/acylaminoacyl peptidase